MIAVRPSRERLRTRIGWLDSRHTFTFEEHIDPRHMGFRALRVLNEDRVAPGHGYGTHPRRDLELLTYVIAGAVRHQDSLGSDTVVAAGGLQRISAGTGILHTESNASSTEPLHAVQLWITPARNRLRPGYEHRSYSPEGRARALTLIGSNDGRERSVTLHQDVAITSCFLRAGERASVAPSPQRHLWVQVLTGRLELNGIVLSAGDGAAVSEEPAIHLASSSLSEALLLDLA